MLRSLGDCLAFLLLMAGILIGLELIAGIAIWRELVDLPVHWLIGGVSLLVGLAALLR